jgi:hypothetical protein
MVDVRKNQLVGESVGFGIREIETYMVVNSGDMV